MKERPILFSAPMVRAILEGRKTQTRRIFKVRGPMGQSHPITSSDEQILQFDDGTFHYLSTAAMSGPYPCPYGEPGDRLWVRESWGYRVGCGVNPTTEAVIEYRADSTKATLPVPVGESGLPRQRPNMTDAELLAWWESWRPSIHMPRWASRITLEVTGVHVERLQDISRASALAEGIADLSTAEHIDFGIPGEVMAQHPVRAFQLLWESINGAGSWDGNPFVWVVEFRRIEQEAKAA